jgi:hypothetical protein
MRRRSLAIAVFRDWPYRRHWLAPLLVGLGAAVQHATLTTRDQATAWEIHVAVAGGIAIALAGLGDHVLLVRALRPGGADASTGRELAR